MNNLTKEDRLAAAGQWRREAGSQMPALLLDWFDRAARALPWRENKDPYRVWLSEIMLQQTQVQTAWPYFENFLRQWPTLPDLAAADEEMVLKQWEGLGYYSRARNLLAAARLIQSRFGGQVPDRAADLRSLPGIGDYTAGAILSIAFAQPVAAVDGNVVRVFARLAATPWNPAEPAQRDEVRQLAESILPRGRPGDWNEALMDLGATVCLPRQPRCPECPLRGLCDAEKAGQADRYPLRPVKKARPADLLTVIVLCRQGRVHVRQRPRRGLLAGLYEFDWLPPDPAADGVAADQRVRRAFPEAEMIPLGSLTHKFTHRTWQLDGFLLRLPDSPEPADDGGSWATPAELAALPFPSALSGYRQKVLELIQYPR